MNITFLNTTTGAIVAKMTSDVISWDTANAIAAVIGIALQCEITIDCEDV